MDTADQSSSVHAYKVLFYRTAQGTKPVREWLQSLERPVRFQLGKAIQVLQMNGPALPFARPLGGGLFELRERIGKVRYRVFYGFDKGRIVVLLHTATKDQRVIQDDLALARRRLQDYYDRRSIR